jgi:hypothetical protein
MSPLSSAASAPKKKNRLCLFKNFVIKRISGIAVNLVESQREKKKEKKARRGRSLKRNSKRAVRGTRAAYFVLGLNKKLLWPLANGLTTFRPKEDQCSAAKCDVVLWMSSRSP